MRRALDRSIRLTLPLAIWLASSCGEPKLLQFPGGSDASTPDAPPQIVVPPPRCESEVALNFESESLVDYTVIDGYLPTSIDHVSDCTVLGRLTGAENEPAQPYLMTSFASSLTVGAVGVDEDGAPFDGSGVSSAIAAPDTGNWMAFVAASTNLGTDASVGTNERGIVIYDRLEKTYALVSPTFAEEDLLSGPAASADGHWLSYGVTSEGVSTLYILDTWTGELRSLGTSEKLFNLTASFGPSMKMSDDGQVIVMSFDDRIAMVTRSRTDNDVFDVSDAKGQLLSATGGAFNITLSDDLHLVIFSSAEQLTERDTNDAVDVHIYDRDSQNTGILDERPQTRLLLPSRIENPPVAGTQSKGLSSDGRFVPFLTQGSLITFWPTIGCICPMADTACGEDDPEICGDTGTCLADGVCDYSTEDAAKWRLYVYNIDTLEISLLSNTNDAGGISDGDCTDVGISTSGQYVYAICSSTTLSKDSPRPAENRLYTFVNPLY